MKAEWRTSGLFTWRARRWADRRGGTGEGGGSEGKVRGTVFVSVAGIFSGVVTMVGGGKLLISTLLCGIVIVLGIDGVIVLSYGIVRTGKGKWGVESKLLSGLGFSPPDSQLGGESGFRWMTVPGRRFVGWD
jgi:hypothetical protein